MDRRYGSPEEMARDIERYLCRNGIVIRKFFLNVSKAEQRRRFLERLDDHSKNWKFSPNDVAERQKWKDYMRAYTDAIRETSSKASPWYIIPADEKWFTRLAIAQVIIDTMEKLNLRFPHLTHKKRRELAKAHDDFMTKRGLPKELRLYAHGQGYDMVERPLVRADEPMSIEQGMCLAVHPNYAQDDLFVIVCDNYIVGSNGSERIHKTESKVFEVY